MFRDAASSTDFPTCADCRAMGIPVSDTLAALEADLGHDTLIAFLKAKAGRQADIQTRAPAMPCGDPVARALDWLRRDVGHGRWDVPMGPVGRRASFAWAMLTRLRAGSSLAAIAAEFGCTARAVSRQKTNFIRRGLLPAAGRTTGDTGR